MLCKKISNIIKIIDGSSDNQRFFLKIDKTAFNLIPFSYYYYKSMTKSNIGRIICFHEEF